VTYDSTVPEGALQTLGDLLPNVVCQAVDCPEEPCVGPVQIGDMEIRFHAKGSLDVGELNCVIEVRTKLFPSRERDKQRRADLIRDRISESSISARSACGWFSPKARGRRVRQADDERRSAVLARPSPRDHVVVRRFWRRSRWPRSGKDAVGVWQTRNEDDDDGRSRREPPKRRGDGSAGVNEPRRPAPSSGSEGVA
jgi:hypothetical protein